MLLKKPMKILMTVMMLVVMSVSTLTVCAANPDMNRKGSVTVVLQKQGAAEAIHDGEFTIYQVAGIHQDDADLTYELTAGFEGSQADLTTLEDAKLAETLAAYAKEHKLSGEASAVPVDGKVVFGDLKPGLFLVVQTIPSEGYYPAKSFLVSAPVKDEETQQWIYDVDATPKTEIKPDENWKPVDIAVKKVWEDDGKNRPKSVTAGLYKDDTLAEKVILNDENQWSYTWTKLDGNQKWTVKEINVPKGYAVSYNKTGTVITMKNTKSLIQTGQLNWPVPVMAFSGLVLILTGFALLHSKRNTR